MKTVNIIALAVAAGAVYALYRAEKNKDSYMQQQLSITPAEVAADAVNDMQAFGTVNPDKTIKPGEASSEAAALQRMLQVYVQGLPVTGVMDHTTQQVLQEVRGGRSAGRASLQQFMQENLFSQKNGYEIAGKIINEFNKPKR